MEGGSARNEAEKEDHLLQTRSSDNLPPANYGKQPQLCMLSLLFTERVTSFLTVMLILMISVPRSMGDIAKRQLLYERIQMEDHPSFEIFCTYQNRIDVVQRSIEVLLAIPFGMLADKKGVRLIACLSLTGLILGDVYMYTVPYFGKVFPLSSVYGATILSAIGGGTIVYNGLVMAIMAIATPGTSRAPFFFWARAIFSLSSFITSFVNVLTITSGSNEYTFTFPADQARSVVLISVCVQALGFVILFFMPLYTMGIENSMPETATAATIVPTRQAFRSDLASSLPQRCVLAGLAGLATYGMGQIVFSRATVALFKAAMEQRSEIERVRTMERVNDIICLVLFIAVLPAVYLFLLREKRDAAAANIALVRGSTALLAVGALSLGISSMKWALNSSLSTEPSSVRYYYWIYNLLHIVASYDAPLRSVLTFIVPVSQFSVLFTSIEATRFLAASGGWEMFKYFSVLGHTGLLFLPLFIVGAFHAFAWLLQ
ncbi:hypothetical protein VFPPC_11342 [Pochonia chlamydosporia 170]|uniref:Uncharacterized protein n=1 Tax=Pochonia chlamydosporia 170 TaxID=1380566 RepID=A0A179EZ28_METCM|nr:hypothetical protein VFPPC_11342 [Pochonia chlamydosporia 170]OAQ58093.2 hypothetical protein VFPPC_11342 [Pochonia chlamydosporia 170]